MNKFYFPCLSKVLLNFHQHFFFLLYTSQSVNSVKKQHYIYSLHMVCYLFILWLLHLENIFENFQSWQYFRIVAFFNTFYFLDLFMSTSSSSENVWALCVCVCTHVCTLRHLHWKFWFYQCWLARQILGTIRMIICLSW